jgi:hypothetical protein
VRLLLTGLLATAAVLVARPATATDVAVHLLGDDSGHWEVVDAAALGDSGRVRAIARRRTRTSDATPPEAHLWTIDAASGVLVDDVPLELGMDGPRLGDVRFAGSADAIVAVAGGRYARLRIGDPVQAAIGPSIDTLLVAHDLRGERTLVAGARRLAGRTSLVDFASGTVADVDVPSGAPYVTGAVDAGGLGFVLVGARHAEEGASGPVFTDVWVGSFTPTGVLRTEATFAGRNPRVVAATAGTAILAFDAATEHIEEQIVAVALSIGLDVRWRREIATLVPQDAIEPPHVCALPGDRVLIATVADGGPWAAVIDATTGESRIVLHGTEQRAHPPYTLACAGARGVLFSTGVRAIESGGRPENLMKVKMLSFAVDGG